MGKSGSNSWSIRQNAYICIFPIAFAVANSQNIYYWKWSFEKLSTIVEKSCELSIIFDRCPSILAAKDVWYPYSHHGICLVHLKRNVEGKYKELQQKDMVGRAGEAFNVSKFNKMYELIKLVDWSCWEYLEKINVKLWILSHSKGRDITWWLQT